MNLAQRCFLVLILVLCFPLSAFAEGAHTLEEAIRNRNHDDTFSIILINHDCSKALKNPMLADTATAAASMAGWNMQPPNDQESIRRIELIMKSETQYQAIAVVDYPTCSATLEFEAKTLLDDYLVKLMEKLKSACKKTKTPLVEPQVLAEQDFCPAIYNKDGNLVKDPLNARTVQAAGAMAGFLSGGNYKMVSGTCRNQLNLYGLANGQYRGIVVAGNTPLASVTLDRQNTAEYQDEFLFALFSKLRAMIEEQVKQEKPAKEKPEIKEKPKQP
ncbi:hypothetical protein JW752_01035 [Candidatus Peregrinibacteria bacterium]|nr:hypothetical protein [Candidatus Peregrinibacteria bacterium]